ncbi:uncharacterized protein LOC126373214 isoform X2 [Pectinophora gossypiella]|uniref:uncharacterized protein LOC126373214 isoform X2 n=1 Tax=Pectinophora gossypiella TaxID=13191 RepID=UPI00214E354A|nr:uncharacterized protein LOC126373214 isoform X2 [Pectinophora gossypiella]
MRIDIPQCGRCCVCIPLRHGILIFGYLNLAFSTFLLSFEIWLTTVHGPEYTVAQSLRSSTVYLYRGVGLYSQMWFYALLYILEILFNILLLIGAHMRARLLRVYYYYGITTSLAALVSFVVMRNSVSYGRQDLQYKVLELAVVFSGLMVQAYLLLLIRSELKKLDQKNQMCFVNHASEVYADLCDGEGRNPL